MSPLPRAPSDRVSLSTVAYFWAPPSFLEPHLTAFGLRHTILHHLTTLLAPPAQHSAHEFCPIRTGSVYTGYCSYIPFTAYVLVCGKHVQSIYLNLSSRTRVPLPREKRKYIFAGSRLIRGSIADGCPPTVESPLFACNTSTKPSPPQSPLQSADQIPKLHGSF
jgi:hypothetical protein